MTLNKTCIMLGGQFLQYPTCSGLTTVSDSVWLSRLIGERNLMSFKTVGEMIQ